MKLNSSHIKFFKDYFSQKSGIILGEEKAYLIETRLTPVIRKLGLKSFNELILNLKLNKPDAVRECIDAISTNETFFFRDKKPFYIFEKTILPQIAANKDNNIRILSAACSSGQEPYSIAMALAENEEILKGKKVEIIGVDVSASILKEAENATYSLFEIERGLSDKLINKYFDKIDENSWQVKKSIRERVRFQKANLLDDLLHLGEFDCIFCRYVLIYFDDENKKSVTEKLAKLLKPGGAFITGTSETNNLCPELLTQYEELRSVFFRK